MYRLASIVILGLFISVQAFPKGGTGTWGGGDSYTFDFRNVANELILELKTLRDYCLYNVNPDVLKTTLDEVFIESTDDILIVDGKRREAANNPVKKIIRLNRSDWDSIATRDLRRQIVLHELLGVSGEILYIDLEGMLSSKVMSALENPSCKNIPALQNLKFQEKHVWPVGQRLSNDYGILKTFGPAIDDLDKVHFHCGIDFEIRETMVKIYALADGVVSIDSSNPDSSNIMVTHLKPGATECKTNGCYYSLYKSVPTLSVVDGVAVTAGQTLGVVFQPTKKIHFELRNNELDRKHCINPFLVLPSLGAYSGEVFLRSVSQIGEDRFDVRVSILSKYVDYDLNHVELAVIDPIGGIDAVVESKYINFMEWHSVFEGEISSLLNLTLEPHQSSVFTGYSIDVTFKNVHLSKNIKNPKLRVRAYGASGRVAEVWSK